MSKQDLTHSVLSSFEEPAPDSQPLLGSGASAVGRTPDAASVTAIGASPAGLSSTSDNQSSYGTTSIISPPKFYVRDDITGETTDQTDGELDGVGGDSAMLAEELDYYGSDVTLSAKGGHIEDGNHRSRRDLHTHANGNGRTIIESSSSGHTRDPQQALYAGGDDTTGQGLDMQLSGYSQKYFKKARRPAHRRRVLGGASTSSRGDFAARSAQLAGMMGSSVQRSTARQGESSDDEEEEFEPEWRFRVSAACTCDTYLLSGVYGALRDKNTIARLLLSTTSSALVTQRQQQGSKRLSATGPRLKSNDNDSQPQSKLPQVSAHSEQNVGSNGSASTGLYFIDTDSVAIGGNPILPDQNYGAGGTTAADDNPDSSSSSAQLVPAMTSVSSSSASSVLSLPQPKGVRLPAATITAAPGSDPTVPPLPAKASFMYYGSDVLHMKLRTSDILLQKHLFVFEYGCLAFFNFTEEEEQFIRSILEPYQEDTLVESEREVGIEDMTYVYGSVSAVSNDTITLSSFSSLEKLSVAFAMAQCVKLNVFEERIDEEIERNRELPESLAARGSIGLTRNEMAKKVGKLFIERNNINLHADILDDPEFFWEQDKYKHVYERLFKYLELGKRVSLLNKRLGIMKELFDMIADQLDNLHAEKLEYIIIYLIVIEVVVAVGWNILVKDVLGFFHHSE